MLTKVVSPKERGRVKDRDDDIGVTWRQSLSMAILAGKSVSSCVTFAISNVKSARRGI